MSVNEGSLRPVTFFGSRRPPPNPAENTPPPKKKVLVVKRVYQQYLRTRLCVKFKFTVLVMGDVDLNKRQCLHPNAMAFTHTTTTATTAAIITTASDITVTKAKATTINFTDTPTSAIIMTTGATTTVTKTKSIMTKF